ncbi:MAG: NADP-dependent oxidoreductase [Propionibacteriales bacterium]|nr:NADP-dependent oxidoreductase [Propionibacteriales bacterium]
MEHQLGRTAGAVQSLADQNTPQMTEVTVAAPGPGEILIKVAAAAINPADLMISAGALREAFGLSATVGLGYDLSRVVVEAGPQVTDFAPGDQVVGLHDDLTAPVRGQAALARIPAAAAAHLPDGIDLTDVASVPLNALTADQGLDLLGESQGRSLLVTGAAGAVGGNVVALAARRGWRVTGLARAGDEDFVRASGAVEFLTDLPSRTHDAVFDAAALQDTALEAVVDGGALLGVIPVQPVAGTRGINVSMVTVRADGPRLAALLDLVAEGTLPVRVAGQRPLADAAETYAEASRPGQRGRWLLIP